MGNEKLDEWAAKFIGEDEDTIGDAVASQWYTTSPGAAFVVLNKCVAEGMDAGINFKGGEVEVTCGDAKAVGPAEKVAELIVKACHDCHNG